ncbi:uncharacterized protein LOC142703140 [Rhinoderma darwinii]|uniref:uncharacterized protein LOC142703140 n=1 Tax=Rhinoderma darwinii TaxID=43563 RepID=UPI003F67F27B
MAETRELVTMEVDRPETLLFSVTKDGTMRIGLPPRHRLDSYGCRSVDIGKLENVSHVIISPEGELFCVRAGDLYRGPLPSKKDVDWFSIARRVGRNEWNKFKILFFHPNGELHGITNDGEFYKGPQPGNENVPWIYGQATKIGAKGWDHCEAIFFDPCGILYVVNKEDKIVKAKPPTGEEYEEWLKTSSVAGGCGWLPLIHFMSFSPDGKLWSVDKRNGNIYRGTIPEDGRYVDNAELLGWDYHHFRFLYFTIDKTISNIISFEFLPENGKRVSECPEMIEERIYNNRGSTSTLKHNFTFDKTVKSSSTFSHEHGFTFGTGALITFKGGIPFISEIEGTVKIDLSTSHNWNFTETNETEVKFSSSSEVELQAGKAIRVVASLVKAELLVPYRARVRTLFGFETEIEGMWTGATLYDLMVKQEDYGKQQLQLVNQEE